MSITVQHRRVGQTWSFECAALEGITGGARTSEASIDSANHAVRVHLSQVLGYPVSLAVAQAVTRHTVDEPPGTPGERLTDGRYGHADSPPRRSAAA